MSSQSDISVIIPVFNGAKYVGNCLDSLLAQERKPCEIIVIDNGSTDGTLALLHRYEKIRLIGEPIPGASRARNKGAQKAKGSILAFLDADCIAAHDWLEKTASSHRSPYNAIGGIVKSGNKEDDLVGWAGYIAEFREFLPEQPKQEVMHIPTCNISYKRRVFRKFGLFQGEYYPQEDLVYNYNLCKNGETILLDPAIQIYHYHRSGLREFLYHQNKIGKITAKVLKVIRLEGSFVVRHPALAMFLIPFLPIVKFTRTVLVFLKFQPESITKRPLVLLLFALGLVYWAVGFTCGTYEKRQL